MASQDQPAVAPVILQVRGIEKKFPGVRALKGVSLDLHHGEVLAVIGENGAGKSTLMKILAGVQRSDAGEMRLDGRSVSFGSVRDATDHGIALIHQELNLSDNLDVASNIFLGREPRRAGMFIDKTRIRNDAKAYLERLGLDVSPRCLVSRLSIGHQQMVEIAKALSVNAKILIMDEPTSSLSQGETDHLYRVIEDLKQSGVSIIYISHRLGEVKAIADRVVVLRDGENAGELARQEIEHDAMVKLMVGRDVDRARHRDPLPPGERVLRVERLITRAYPRRQVSFDLHASEIVGIAGLVGAGRTEILQALFGAVPALAGSISVAGETLAPQRPLDAIRAGIAFVPEDRKLQGLVLEMAIRNNIMLPNLHQEQRLGFTRRAREKEISAASIKRLNVKTPSDTQVVQLLSGGNQQKIVLGKWLAMNPRILLLDEPTRGIDVGAKREIYQLMEQLARQGVAILFVSSEMEEILAISDRVLVVHEGEITGILAHNQLSEEAVMQLATGKSAA